VNIEKPEAQHHGSREPMGRKAGSLDRTNSVALLIITLLVLNGVATVIALRCPSAVTIAAAYINGYAPIPPVSPAQDHPDRMAKESEKKPEPFIADDIRMQGLMYASAEAAASLPRAVPDRTGFIC
jgi:hypothetical protein